jgi:hypothetical protein
MVQLVKLIFIRWNVVNQKVAVRGHLAAEWDIATPSSPKEGRHNYLRNADEFLCDHKAQYMRTRLASCEVLFLNCFR